MHRKPQTSADPQSSFVAIVLAAGLSRRMGAANKLLLPLQGQPLVRLVVQQALQACEQVVVVLGHEADKVRAALEGLGVSCVHNPHYEQGMGTSVSAGAGEVPAGRSALICLGDMPGVTAQIMHELARAGAAAGTAACRPVFEGQPGNPVWWASDQVAALRSMSGDEGARALLKDLRTQGRLYEMPVQTSGVLWDIDTPQDWQEAGER